MSFRPMLRAMLAACASLFVAAPVSAAPSVFWVSDPVAPGQSVIVFGDGFTGCSKINWERLPDKAGSRSLTGSAAPLQAGQHSVKFTLPDNMKPGIFRVKIDTPSGPASIELNRPQVTWAQGDAGTPGTPGGWIRVCGKCLSAEGYRPAIKLAGTNGGYLLTPDRAEPFTLQARIPANVPAGEYRLTVSSGQAMAEGWSEPVLFRVVVSQIASHALFNVPPPSSKVADNAPALQKVLDQAGEHGGIVRLPAGRWLLDAGLTIPPHVTLRGAGMNRSALCWVDTAAPPAALIQGDGYFQIADVSLYARQYKRGIVSSLGSNAAGHVSIDRVRMRLNRFRNHINPEEVQARYLSAGDGDALRVGGEDVEIVGCDIFSAGRPICLSGASGGRVFDNQFHIGRDGWYCLSGSNGLLFERNLIEGDDLQASGGGINTLDGSLASQNVYFAGNTVKSIWGGDHEGMTSDGAGGIYYGKVEAVKGTVLTLAGDVTMSRWRKDWNGGAVFIMDGKGQGQYRQVTGIEGRNVTLDRPWTVEPDDASLVSITILSRNFLLIGNTFTDTGVALQMYGSSVGHIAYGNTSERSGGYYCFGRNYHGVQPCWYIEWLGNKITDGTVYMGGPDSIETMGEAQIAVQGGAPNVTPVTPMTLGIVVRGNDLQADAHIEVTATGTSAPFPLVHDVVVEDNHVSNAQIGLIIGVQTEGVLARENVFNNCAIGIQSKGDLVHQADRFVGCGKSIVDDRTAQASK
ncbi:MAG: hypothetical protein P4L33_14215 [Capsulimonadaceae bacterium]|nr:hypothetical protein [Capsulimonadaceae bacterium]